MASNSHPRTIPDPMITIRKATKHYDCDACSHGIKRGELYNSQKIRGPRYDGTGKQVGIEYYHSRTHAENCQAGNPEYIWRYMCEEHEWIWRGPSQKERYCYRCMRLESQVYPDMHRWGLVPTGVKSWEHPRMSKSEIRSIRYNLIVSQINALIRKRNSAVIRLESELAMEFVTMYHTNIDVQWRINSTLINVEGLMKLDAQHVDELRGAFGDLLRFFRELHQTQFPELEYTVNHNFYGQYQKISMA